MADAAAVKKYTLGLSKIEVGDIASDGDMGATLEQLGYTYQDSCSLSMEDPESTDFYAEEVDDPVVSISRAGKITFSWSLMNPSVSTIAALMGGTADTDANTWSAPDSQPTIEKSVKITPKQGFVFEIPRLKIDAKLTAPFSRSDIVVIAVTGTVLAPTKDGVAKLKITPIE